MNKSTRHPIERPATRSLILGDEIAAAIASWRKDAWVYDTLSPPSARAAKREELKRWLPKQFALLRAGKPSAIKAFPPRP